MTDFVALFIIFHHTIYFINAVIDEDCFSKKKIDLKKFMIVPFLRGQSQSCIHVNREGERLVSIFKAISCRPITEQLCAYNQCYM